jgi:hypothetical protein
MPSLFLQFKLKFSAVYWPTWSVLHAIRRFRRQNSSQKLFEPLSTNMHKAMKHRMQFLPDFTVFACGALWQFAKRAQITFGAVAKGNRSPF